MSKKFQSELVTTKDGSHTLRIKGHDEQYHSMNGALQESMHVFLNRGFGFFEPTPDPLHILEVGLGTGLNALLTARMAVEKNIKVVYQALEPYPLTLRVLEKLNYPQLFAEPWAETAYHHIHSAPTNTYSDFCGLFYMRSVHEKVQDVVLEKNKHHLVYFDAFGPDTQPEMWSEQIFEKLYGSMRGGGVLVTYSAKGAVRRALKAAGFQVEKLPGPPGKREMTRALKTV